MAKTWKFGYQNDGARAAESPFTNIQLNIGSYALKQDEPDECQLSNTTTPIDQPELVTYQSSTIKKIPTKVKVSNPTSDTEGVMYGVRVDEVLRGTSDTDDNFIVDLPIVVNISVKHPINSAISAGVVNEAISRALSALTTDSGTSRVTDLMRSALKPTTN